MAYIWIFSKTVGLAAAVLILLIECSTLLGQSQPKTGWSTKAEVSGVWVGGNSVSRTVGVSATVTHQWPKSSWTAKGGGLRTESTLKTRSAVGSPEDFEIEETLVTTTTAEAYYARSSYEYRFSGSAFAIGGVDWLRNTFSGIDSRVLVGVGAGNNWIDDDRTSFETIFGFTYTFESEVVQNPFNTGKFPGLRLGYTLETALTETAQFESELDGDWNLDNTADVRIDWTNAISVSISSKLALKPSLKVLWRNDPAHAKVPLQAPDGTETGESVLVPLGKLDTFLRLALVMTV